MLFVDPTRPYAVVHARTSDPDAWLSHTHRSLDDAVQLGDLSLPMREIYRKVKFDPAGK